MAQSNYEFMRNQMRVEFIKYNQQKMIEKFHLTYDESYLYIDFVGRPNGWAAAAVWWSGRKMVS